MQGLILTFANDHLHMKIKTYFLSRTTGWVLTQFWMNHVVFRFLAMKIYKYNAGHMTKMAAMPVFGKIPLNSSFKESQEIL